jgi:hypothetical protein
MRPLRSYGGQIQVFPGGMSHQQYNNGCKNSQSRASAIVINGWSNLIGK